ncbi:MAG: hypothetical protein V4467_01755 [Patescibacteria group bacterium]
MKIIKLFDPWKLATYRARDHADHLERRLQKFCLLSTPEDVVAKGEKWGNGQILTTRDGGTQIWRGQINSAWFEQIPQPKWITPTGDGVLIELKLTWFARRIPISLTLGKREKPKILWVRDSQSLPYSLKITIASFYQNKGGKALLSRNFFPRRLFFTTTDGEQGFFTRDNDPENLILRDHGLHDPTTAKPPKKKKS